MEALLKNTKDTTALFASLLLFSGLCLTSSTGIAFFMLTEALTGIFLYKVKQHPLINCFGIWYLVVSAVLCLYGLLTPYSGGFSIGYFVVIFISVIELYCLLTLHSEAAYEIIMKCIKLTTYITAAYLLLIEAPYLFTKLIPAMMGKAWYRIGVNSNINPTAIAYFFGLAANFSIFGLIKNFNKKNIYPIIIQVLIIILSGSKKGILLLFIPFFVFAIYESIKTPKKALIFIGIAILFFVLIFTVPFLYNLIGYRILALFQTIGINIIPNNSVYAEADTSTPLRFSMIEEAFELFKKHMLFGNGWNAFKALTEFKYYSHCNYLELLSCMGLFGFSVYYSIYFYFIYKLKSAWKSECFILCASLFLSLLISDFSTITIYDTVMNYFAVIVLSILLGCKQYLPSSFKQFFNRRFLSIFHKGG